MGLSGREASAATEKRGDTAIGVQLAGRRVRLSRFGERGFSLIELVMTLTIMTILTMGVIPLVKLSVKRQKEQQLRLTLRQMREAIDQFHREAVRSPCQGTLGTVGAGAGGTNSQVPLDPRIKVVISDCTIFGVDNPDRYPPSLETLVQGVNVIPFGAQAGYGNPTVKATDLSSQLATKTKIYLRAIPVDPMTGEKDWDFRSCYDAADSSSWGGENVFDVRSKSRETALNGEKYSDW